MEGRGGEDQILGLRSVFSVLLPNHLSGVEVSPLVQLPSFLSLEEAFPGWGEKCWAMSLGSEESRCSSQPCGALKSILSRGVAPAAALLPV